MPLRRRCKRHFVICTTDGPLVTVNPTPGSMLPESFKKAKVRSLEASRDTLGSVPASRRSRRLATDGDKAVNEVAPPQVRRPRGGPILEFAPIAPIPDGFGVPADDAELTRRERLGTLDRQPCALCHHTFDRTKLQFRVSRKAIVERQARWGRCALKGKDLTAANLYESCLVCLFCYQFFEETIRESCSLLEAPDDNEGYELSYNSMRPSPCRPFSDAPCAAMSSSSMSLLAASQSHVSPPEFVEELRIQQDQRRSQHLLNCLGREWEAQQRQERLRRFRHALRDHRTLEASRWHDRVETARRQLEADAAVHRQPSSMPHGPTTPAAVPVIDTGVVAMDGQHTTTPQPSILKQRSTPAPGHVAATDATANTSGAFCSNSAGLLSQPSLSVSPSLDVDAVGSGGAMSDRPCHSHRSRRGSDCSTARVVTEAGAADGAGHESHRSTTPPPSPTTSGVDDFGEIDLTDDLRAILSATPRSARGMHLSGGPSAFAIAKEMLKAKKDKQGSPQRPGTAPLRTTSHRSPKRQTKAYRLRVQAAEATKLQIAEGAYVRDCELRGVHPSPSRLAGFYGAQTTGNTTTPAATTEVPWAQSYEAATLLQGLSEARSRRLVRRSSLLDLHDRRASAASQGDHGASEGYDLANVLRFRGSKRFSMYTL